MSLMKSVLAAVLLAGVGLCSPSIGAESYPAANVTIVVPFPAGGTADILPRILAEALSQKWKQAIVIENRSGAGGNIGAEYVTRAQPDGYRLLASPPGPLVVNPDLYKKLPFDAASLVPITVLATAPNVLVVGPNVKAGSMQALIKEAKENPGKISYASQGIGSTSHLTASLFEMMGRLKLVHVPYKGSAPALNDLMGGHVDIMFDNLGSSLPLHRSGKVKILAVATPRRIASLPDLPTIAEAGLPNFQSVTWFGLLAPPGTPAALVAEINHAVVEILRAPEVRKRFLELGVEPIGNTPEEMARFVKEERARWADVIKAANVTLD